MPSHGHQAAPLGGLQKPHLCNDLTRRSPRTHEDDTLFDEQVLRKRPYIHRSWCTEVIANPLQREVQRDGRVRYWGEVRIRGEPAPRILHVVTLANGETVHNAFFDRGYRRNQP